VSGTRDSKVCEDTAKRAIIQGGKTHRHRQTHTCTQTQTDTHMHTDTNAHRHTCTHTHTCKYAHMRVSHGIGIRLPLLWQVCCSSPAAPLALECLALRAHLAPPLDHDCPGDRSDRQAQQPC
jgi:hypothetical protein